MDILADENIKEEAVFALRSFGHNVAWVREDSSRAEDWINLARAVAEDRLLITYDADYEDLLFRDRMPASCGVVLFVFSGSPSERERAELITAAMSAEVQWTQMFRRIVFKFSVPYNLERQI